LKNLQTLYAIGNSVTGKTVIENAAANNTKIVVLSTPMSEGNLIEKMSHFFLKRL